MLPDNDWMLLKFWESGECQVCMERLDDYDRQGIVFCPRRHSLFRSLSIRPILGTKVAILVQDPYPNPMDATGVAFSIPQDRYPYPPTLRNILAEYYSDLRYPAVKGGCLETWCHRGVLLWNVYPTCLMGQPASCHWDEWRYLTMELVEVLDAQGVLLVSLGAVANSFIVDRGFTAHWSHPSPLGYRKGINPFAGSRMFSSINDKLCSRGLEPINWLLP